MNYLNNMPQLLMAGAKTRWWFIRFLWKGICNDWFLYGLPGCAFQSCMGCNSPKRKLWIVSMDIQSSHWNLIVGLYQAFDLIKPSRFFIEAEFTSWIHWFRIVFEDCLKIVLFDQGAGLQSFQDPLSKHEILVCQALHAWQALKWQQLVLHQVCWSGARQECTYSAVLCSFHRQRAFSNFAISILLEDSNLLSKSLISSCRQPSRGRKSSSDPTSSSNLAQICLKANIISSSRSSPQDI